MKVLLSIKPEFADLIFQGIKKFEFRKSIFKRPDIKTIVVYSSSPVQKVIGEFEIETILTDKVEKIWNKTKKFSGIDKEYYNEYFQNKENAFAIKIKNVKKYKTPLCLKKDFKLHPPQSFLYLETNI